MSLPPLPAGPRARPSFVVLAISGAIGTIQLLSLYDFRLGEVVDPATAIRSVATLILVGLLAIYHLRRRTKGMEIARSELRYRMLAEETADLAILIGQQSSNAYVSKAITALIGYTLAEIGTTPIRAFIHPDDRDDAMRRLKALSRATPRDNLVLRLRHKDESYLWVEANVCRIEQADGASEIIITLRDVTNGHREAEALRLATLDAQRAQAEADHANKAKTEFLAHMSHEIRTPLNSVIGFSGLLLATPDLPASIRLHVERIRAGGNALLTVVNDILDFSQVEAGALELELRPFPLPGLIDECISLVQQSATAKSLSIHVAVMERLPEGVLGDPARLRQILLNLLNNAIKFTTEGSVLLDIRVDRSNGAKHLIKFSVIDTGIGIAKDDRSRLFQRFAQVDASIRRTYGGTGLGLAICKRLVELMDGTIGFESEKGVGSTFWCTLPLPPANVAPEPAASDRPIALRPIHILLVEDVPINQDLVRHLLEATGHTVDVVCNGAEAIMAVLDMNYDVVLMDIQMPYLDGLAATRTIRGLPDACRNVPIVAMTANVLPDQVAIARDAGMVDVIHKPISASQMHATLARVIANAPTTLDDFLSESARGDAHEISHPDGPGDCDIAILAKLASLIGDAKVKTLLDGLAVSLEGRFSADPDDPEGRATLRRQAHASVAGSGMLGFSAFAAHCKALEHAREDEAFADRVAAFIADAAKVVDAARALSRRDEAITTLAA